MFPFLKKKVNFELSSQLVSLIMCLIFLKIWLYLKDEISFFYYSKFSNH